MFPADSIAYQRNGTLHIRDSTGHHWAVRIHHRSGAPYTTTIPKQPAKLYGRPSGQTSYSDSLRGIAHGLMNLVSQEGAWAWYTGFGGKKNSPVTRVQHGYRPSRNHTEVMNQATTNELGSKLSATQYARAGHGAVLTRGHSAISYEWCHLVSHGLGGPDQEGNIVAATKFQNTEQLILENVLYEYRMEELSIQVQAKLANGTRHLGESIYYKVLLESGQTAYSRTMDARRATNVTYDEIRSVGQAMRASINAALAQQYPTNGFDPKILQYVEDNSEVIEEPAFPC